MFCSIREKTDRDENRASDGPVDVDPVMHSAGAGLLVRMVSQIFSCLHLRLTREGAQTSLTTTPYVLVHTAASFPAV